MSLTEDMRQTINRRVRQDAVDWRCETLPICETGDISCETGDVR